MFFHRAACLAGFLLAAWAQDWPHWRGPNRDGIAGAFSEPKVWPEKLKLKWKVNVGEGHSSPVVVGGKIFLHTRQGDREVVSCLRPETGQVIWQEGYAAPYAMNPAAVGHGKGVKSTPVVADGRICTFGINGILSCFDAKTGKPLWRKEFGSPDFGTATSPERDRKSTRLNSSHSQISYAVFCLKKKKEQTEGVLRSCSPASSSSIGNT